MLRFSKGNDCSKLQIFSQIFKRYIGASHNFIIFVPDMKTKEALITVVIPVYNREALVVRTLEALSRQTSNDFCVILVDNCSTDGTLAILQQWAEKQDFSVNVIQESRRGAAAARQRALSEVSTPWTMFFDSDDDMAPEHIARAAEAIKANSSADLIGWDIRFHYHNGKCSVKPFESRDAQFHSLFHGSMSTQRYLARTELFIKAGGWNPDVPVWNDIELGARLLNLNPTIVKLHGRPTVDVYLGSDSISRGVQASNIAVLDRSLNAIGATLGENRAHWLDLKRVTLAANSHDNAGEALYKKVISGAKTHRTLLKLAYHYTRSGGRAIARLLRPLI